MISGTGHLCTDTYSKDVTARGHTQPFLKLGRPRDLAFRLGSTSRIRKTPATQHGRPPPMRNRTAMTTPDLVGARQLGTVGKHASRRVPTASAHDPAGRVVDGLRGGAVDSAAVVAVLDDDRLLGLVTLERLLSAPSETGVRRLMDVDPPVVSSTDVQEQRRGEPSSTTNPPRRSSTTGGSSVLCPRPHCSRCYWQGTMRTWSARAGSSSPHRLPS